jgi:hypothetical protein
LAVVLPRIPASLLASRAQECHGLAMKAVGTFAKREQVTVEEVKVVLEGSEPDAFWDMFELG